MPERPYKHIDIARSPTSVASVEHVLRGNLQSVLNTQQCIMALDTAQLCHMS